jgi:DNA-binding NtrC family response regulator
MMVGVRVVALIRGEAEGLMEEGKLRRDLYHRLGVHRIRVPPLRERREDIAELAEQRLREISWERREPKKRLTKEALERLLKHPWPGNVRQLRNELERASLGRGEWISVERVLEDQIAVQVGKIQREAFTSLKDELSRREREVLTWVLSETGGRRLEAARLLGIERKTLFRKLRQHRID